VALLNSSRERTIGDYRRTYHALVALALAMPLAARGASAQAPGTITGVVTNAISGAPVANARVTVRGFPDTAMTDGEGWYTLEGVVPGLVKVYAQSIGYVPIMTPYYSVMPNSTRYVDFKLAPLVVQLDTLRITGARPGRGRGSEVITREQLPSQGSILDALRGAVAGLRVTGRHDGTRVKARSSRSDMLYVIDGIVVRPPLTFHIDAQDVDCVEIRRGYRAVSEYKASLNSEPYSGVILIWTRGSIDRRPAECFNGS
jgi:hypothetical protein